MLFKKFLTARPSNQAAQQRQKKPDRRGIPFNVARKTVATAIHVEVPLIVCYLLHSIVLAVIINEKNHLPFSMLFLRISSNYCNY